MATVPGPPGVFRILTYTNTRVDGDVNGGDTGGSVILQHQVAYGTSPNVPGNGGGFGNLTIGTGSGFITGLTPGSTYYFWNRMRNAIGWGPWSPRNHVRMRSRPDPTDYPKLHSMSQTTIKMRIYPNYNGDSPITQYRLSYGSSPNIPGAAVTSASQDILLTGLSPGALYYFWGQAINAYGISDYSPRSYVSLIAGSKIKVNGVWRRGVPYVKVAGVWRVGRPWGKIAGFWNESPE